MLVNGLVLLALGGAIELFLRVRSGSEPIRPEPIDARGLHVPDPELAHVMRPNLHLTVVRDEFAVDVTTNALGFRDREIGPKRLGTFRILSLGDSYAFGFGVEADETYAKQVERGLNEVLGGRPPVEVINAGTSGYSTLQELRALRRHGAALDPDLVLLGFTAQNDFTDNLRSSAVWHEQFDAWTAGWLRARSRLFELFEYSVRRVEHKILHRRAFELTLELTEEIEKTCRALGVRLVVMAIPARPDPENPLTRLFNRLLGSDPGRRYDAFVSRVGELGIPVFDAREGLDAADLGEAAYFRSNHHWRPEGHRAAAAGLRDFLIERDLLAGPR